MSFVGEVLVHNGFFVDECAQGEDLALVYQTDVLFI